jgi:hypothetical protein
MCCSAGMRNASRSRTCASCCDKVEEVLDLYSAHRPLAARQRATLFKALSDDVAAFLAEDAREARVVFERYRHDA